MSKATKNLSVWRTAIARASRVGSSCCWTCSGGAGRRVRIWSSATGPWACGRPCARCIRELAHPALLGAQDAQRARQAAQGGAGAGQAQPAADLDGRDPGGGGPGLPAFRAAYEAKYEKAVECLAKDRDDLLAFYDYPAEHWRHLRTTNPIESVFATVRLRTVKTRGCLSRKTAFAMVLQLVLSAQEKWRRLNGPKRLAQVIEGVQFRNGIQEVGRAA